MVSVQRVDVQVAIFVSLVDVKPRSLHSILIPLQDGAVLFLITDLACHVLSYVLADFVSLATRSRRLAHSLSDHSSRGQLNLLALGIGDTTVQHDALEGFSGCKFIVPLVPELLVLSECLFFEVNFMACLE